MIVKIVYHCTHSLCSMDSEELVSIKQTCYPREKFICKAVQALGLSLASVLMPLHKEDNIHFKYLHLYGIVLTLFLSVLSGCVLCMYIGA